jgi:hypothetical protein
VDSIGKRINKVTTNTEENLGIPKKFAPQSVRGRGLPSLPRGTRILGGAYLLVLASSGPRKSSSVAPGISSCGACPAAAAASGIR